MNGIVAIFLIICIFLMFASDIPYWPKYVGDAAELSSLLCNPIPMTMTTSKAPGDNGFKIEVSGNPNKYVPDETYTVTLHGRRTSVSTQKFTAFTLTVDSSDLQHSIGSKDLGAFKINANDTMTMYSGQCQRAVIQTSLVPKTEVKVTWIAPRSGSGCVKFKAVVVELRDRWYMDDGDLTKELCEEEDGIGNVVEECCACDDAKYEVIFQGLWSRNTHPKNFPQDNFLTHFSDIIGASHSPEYTVWNTSGQATEGLRNVAEFGATREMEAEMKQQSHHIRTIIKARGLWFPNLNGSTLAVFRVDQLHHLMSLVTMMGPSPDWIVGVSRMELCNTNCTWVEQKQLDLYPWDAGTNSGVSYQSPRNPTIPREKIRQITSSHPNNIESPFYDPLGLPMKPVARLTVNRQRLYVKPNCKVDPRDECKVTPWRAIGSCSVTCGTGLQLFERDYVKPEIAELAGCEMELEKRDPCSRTGPQCSADPENCVVGSWSSWGECSATCGRGSRSRSRKFLNKKSYKKCSNLLMEKERCVIHETCDCEGCVPEDPVCAVTEWSEWSPCMVTCGKGIKVRTRVYLNSTSILICKGEMMQKLECTAERMTCDFDMSEAKVICSQPKDIGPCRGSFRRWYFDTVRRTCMTFYYGGCRGNKNNFVQLEECNKVCDVMKGIPLAVGTGQAEEEENNYGTSSIDCMTSQWSPWSLCTPACGKRHRTRHRMVKVHPQNGGRECPKLTQNKKCRQKPCSA